MVLLSKLVFLITDLLSTYLVVPIYQVHSACFMPCIQPSGQHGLSPPHINPSLCPLWKRTWLQTVSSNIIIPDCCCCCRPRNGGSECPNPERDEEAVLCNTMVRIVHIDKHTQMQAPYYALSSFVIILACSDSVVNIDSACFLKILFPVSTTLKFMKFNKPYVEGTAGRSSWD